MDDLPAVEIGQTIQDSFRNLPQNLLARAATKLLHLLVDAVQASSFTELHGNRDGPCGFVHERTVVAADMLRGAVFVEIQFPDDLLLDIRIWIGGDDL